MRLSLSSDRRGEIPPDPCGRTLRKDSLLGWDRFSLNRSRVLVFVLSYDLTRKVCPAFRDHALVPIGREKRRSSFVQSALFLPLFHKKQACNLSPTASATSEKCIQIVGQRRDAALAIFCWSRGIAIKQKLKFCFLRKFKTANLM